MRGHSREEAAQKRRLMSCIQGRNNTEIYKYKKKKYRVAEKLRRFLKKFKFKTENFQKVEEKKLRPAHRKCIISIFTVKFSFFLLFSPFVLPNNHLSPPRHFVFILLNIYLIFFFAFCLYPNFSFCAYKYEFLSLIFLKIF